MIVRIAILWTGLIGAAAFAQDVKIRVAVYKGEGVLEKPLSAVEKVLKEFKGVEYRCVSGKEVREGGLRDVQIVLFPGGGARGQGESLGKEGREGVRKFVESGGGYVGICAGAYLATTSAEHYLHLLDAKIVDPKHWKRGVGMMKIKVTEEGRRFFGIAEERVELRYVNGPILAPARQDDLPDYSVLGTFETEVHENGATPGDMIGKPAFTTSTFGKGRVFISSAHPEMTEGQHPLLIRALQWVAKR